jgi:hypothetical protein
MVAKKQLLEAANPRDFRNQRMMNKMLVGHSNQLF